MGFLKDKLSQLLRILSVFMFLFVCINNLEASWFKSWGWQSLFGGKSKPETKKKNTEPKPETKKKNNFTRIFTREMGGKKPISLTYFDDNFRDSGVGSLTVDKKTISEQNFDYLVSCLGEKSIEIPSGSSYGSKDVIIEGIYIRGDLKVDLETRVERFYNACEISKFLSKRFKEKEFGEKNFGEKKTLNEIKNFLDGDQCLLWVIHEGKTDDEYLHLVPCIVTILDVNLKNKISKFGTGKVLIKKEPKFRKTLMLQYRKKNFELSGSKTSLVIQKGRSIQKKCDYLVSCFGGCLVYSMEDVALRKESINVYQKANYGAFEVENSINEGIYTGGNVDIETRLERFHNACSISKFLKGQFWSEIKGKCGKLEDGQYLLWVIDESKAVCGESIQYQRMYLVPCIVTLHEDLKKALEKEEIKKKAVVEEAKRKAAEEAKRKAAEEAEKLKSEEKKASTSKCTLSPEAQINEIIEIIIDITNRVLKPNYEDVLNFNVFVQNEKGKSLTLGELVNQLREVKEKKRKIELDEIYIDYYIFAVFALPWLNDDDCRKLLKPRNWIIKYEFKELSLVNDILNNLYRKFSQTLMYKTLFSYRKINEKVEGNILLNCENFGSFFFQLYDYLIQFFQEKEKEKFVGIKSIKEQAEFVITGFLIYIIEFRESDKVNSLRDKLYKMIGEDWIEHYKVQMNELKQLIGKTRRRKRYEDVNQLKSIAPYFGFLRLIASQCSPENDAIKSEDGASKVSDEDIENHKNFLKMVSEYLIVSGQQDYHNKVLSKIEKVLNDDKLYENLSIFQILGKSKNVNAIFENIKKWFPKFEANKIARENQRRESYLSWFYLMQDSKILSSSAPLCGCLLNFFDELSKEQDRSMENIQNIKHASNEIQKIVDDQMKILSQSKDKEMEKWYAQYGKSGDFNENQFLEDIIKLDGEKCGIESEISFNIIQREFAYCVAFNKLFTTLGVFDTLKKVETQDDIETINKASVDISCALAVLNCFHKEAKKSVKVNDDFVKDVVYGFISEDIHYKNERNSKEEVLEELKKICRNKDSLAGADIGEMVKFIRSSGYFFNFSENNLKKISEDLKNAGMKAMFDEFLDLGIPNGLLAGQGVFEYNNLKGSANNSLPSDDALKLPNKKLIQSACKANINVKPYKNTRQSMVVSLRDDFGDSDSK